MELTISSPKVKPEVLIHELADGFDDVSIINQGSTNNFSEDFIGYVLATVSVSGNIAIGVIANHLYHLIRTKGRKVVLGKKDIKDFTIGEIEEILRSHT